MKNVLLALSLALALGPVAAVADDNANNAPPAHPTLTAAQRQALQQTFQTFQTKEQQLHQQLRLQVLNSISPAHRATIAGIVGQLAISPNPNLTTTAKQLDVLLSQSEQQRIFALHNSYRTQSQALHEQMRAQLQKELPNFPKHNDQHPAMPGGFSHGQMPNLDAGTLLLMILAHPGAGSMMGMGMHHFWIGPGGGPPPR